MYIFSGWLIKYSVWCSRKNWALVSYTWTFLNFEKNHFFSSCFIWEEKKLPHFLFKYLCLPGWLLFVAYTAIFSLVHPIKEVNRVVYVVKEVNRMEKVQCQMRRITIDLKATHNSLHFLYGIFMWSKYTRTHIRSFHSGKGFSCWIFEFKCKCSKH